MEVLDGGLGDPPAEIVVVTVRLRVPLGWVVDEAVEVVGLARLLQFLQHSVLLLQWLPFLGLGRHLRVHAWDHNLGFSQLPDTAGHVFVLNG